ncbi:hypothetical protein D3C76_665900 [compost metagenome]
MKVLENVKQFVENLVSKYSNITIEDEIMVANVKLEYALSTKTHMASISILSDLTYDFYAEGIWSEEVSLMKTKYFNSIEDLFIVLTKDITSFMEL